MAKTTTDHGTIRKWIEERGGHPARVKATGSAKDPGILRVDFPGYSGEGTLETIAWDQFFAWFDRDQLAFIYQDRTRGGQPSRFNKLISRATAAGRGAQGAQPQNDAIGLLTAQHRTVERIFQDLQPERPGSDAYRRLFDELADALALHTTIEEKIFYPSVKRSETRQLLEESVEEHLQAKRVLATLLDAEPDSDTRAELEELAGLVEEHVIEEEHDLFPIVRKIIAAAELRDLGQKMMGLEAELRRGEPRAGIADETEEPAPI